MKSPFNRLRLFWSASTRTHCRASNTRCRPGVISFEIAEYPRWTRCCASTSSKVTSSEHYLLLMTVSISSLWSSRNSEGERNCLLCFYSKSQLSSGDREDPVLFPLFSNLLRENISKQGICKNTSMLLFSQH